MKTLIILAVLILASACTTASGPVPNTQPLIAPTSATINEPNASVTDAVIDDSANDPIGGPLLNRLNEDFTRLGPVSGSEPTGLACSQKGLVLTAALAEVRTLLLSLSGGTHTGFLLTDIEIARLKPHSSLVERVADLRSKLRDAADACAPLLIGPEKFGAALGLPRAIVDLLNGGK